MLSETRIRTNPVLCFEDWLDNHFRSDNSSESRRLAREKLQEWIAAGVFVPGHEIEAWFASGFLDSMPSFSPKTEERRVVGLLYDVHRRVGLVNPLTTCRTSQLRSSPLLPFTAEAIHSLLIKVADYLAGELPLLFPESSGFTFEGLLSESCVGSSMHIAGLLAALDALSDHQCDLFTLACAVVEPGLDQDLISVGNSRVKLEAFVREFKRGSLIVIGPDSEIEAEARMAFQTVWVVSSIEELAKKITTIPIIVDRLMSDDPLGTSQMGLLLSRLRSLEELKDFGRINRLFCRIDQTGFDGHVPLYEQLRILKYAADAQRHTGNFKQSLELMDRLGESLTDIKEVVSDEERLGYAVDKAAAMFDSCDFQGAICELKSWLALCDRDSTRFSAQKRIELFNTAGRCLIMTSEAGWEELFRKSIRIQQIIDPKNVRRTEGYLIAGLLRADSLGDASELVARHEIEPTGDVFYDAFTQFYRIELDRRRMRISTNPPTDVQGTPKYMYAFTLQAYARQPGQASHVSSKFLSDAEQILFSEDANGNSILGLIAAAIQLLRAVIQKDNCVWNIARKGLRDRIANLGEFQSKYFQSAFDCVIDAPDLTLAEKLLNQMPYI